jgi:hypothetical protein
MLARKRDGKIERGKGKEERVTKNTSRVSLTFLTTLFP